MPGFHTGFVVSGIPGTMPGSPPHTEQDCLTLLGGGLCKGVSLGLYALPPVSPFFIPQTIPGTPLQLFRFSSHWALHRVEQLQKYKNFIISL